jgi:protein-disulfide isomerase
MVRSASAAIPERSIGSATAPVVVGEYFSLTCPHCAAFHKASMPQIQEELVKTGKLRMVFHDFPLDQVALTAAIVARALPPERYEPFVAALLASQDRWAFSRTNNTMDELAKMSALAGLSRANFDKAVADTATRDAILADQADAEKTLGVDSTPTFIFNGPAAKNRREAGGRSFAEFAKLVAAAAG